MFEPYAGTLTALQNRPFVFHSASFYVLAASNCAVVTATRHLLMCMAVWGLNRQCITSILNGVISDSAGADTDELSCMIWKYMGEAVTAKHVCRALRCHR